MKAKQSRFNKIKNQALYLSGMKALFKQILIKNYLKNRENWYAADWYTCTYSHVSKRNMHYIGGTIAFEKRKESVIINTHLSQPDEKSWNVSLY